MAASSQKLGALIDEIKRYEDGLDELLAKVEVSKKIIAKKKEALLKKFKKSDLNGARGKLGVASVVERDIPQIGDPQKFYAYIYKKKAFDLLQKRIATTAWVERSEAGERVPGVTVFRDVKLQVRKAR